MYALDCTTMLHNVRTTAGGSLHSNQQLQLGRSSVRGWTRQWPFGIPRRSAERAEVSLKDTFPPLQHSNSIVLTGQWCPTVCRPGNLRVIEFPISHPSIMHLVSSRKEANALPRAGKSRNLPWLDTEIYYFLLIAPWPLHLVSFPETSYFEFLIIVLLQTV